MKVAWFVVVFLFAALPVRAETIDISDNHGGSVATYDARWAGLAQRGVSVRIVGPCQSACTVLLGHIPRSRICVTPDASFGFHLAHLPQATAMLWGSYPAGIKAWVNAHGGLTHDFIWMRAPNRQRLVVRPGQSSRINNCWIQDDPDFAPEQFEQYRHTLMAGHAFVETTAVLESAANNIDLVAGQKPRSSLELH